MYDQISVRASGSLRSTLSRLYGMLYAAAEATSRTARGGTVHEIFKATVRKMSQKISYLI